MAFGDDLEFFTAALHHLRLFRGRPTTSGGIRPPVYAKVLFVILQSRSIQVTVKKSTKDALPQQPSSATITIAASPTRLMETIRDL